MARTWAVGCNVKALTFWKTVVQDRADFLDRLLALFAEHDVRYCVIGGQAVNAYTDPVVSLDLDIVIAVDQLSAVAALLRREFVVETFPHSVNVSAKDSNLRVQLRTDPRYAAFVDRAQERDVLGIVLPVASLDDLLQGKLWAALDNTRRPSKRQKDLADISRLREAYPLLADRIPEEIRRRLL